MISVGKLYIVKERCSEWRESLGISMCVTVKTMGDTERIESLGIMRIE